MSKTTTTKTATTAITERYKVSEVTAKYLELLKATARLYEQIQEANRLNYSTLGADKGDEAAESINAIYAKHLNEVDDLIRQAILTQISDGLNDGASADEDVTII